MSRSSEANDGASPWESNGGEARSWVMHGGGETSLSAVRPCGMGVTP